MPCPACLLLLLLSLLAGAAPALAQQLDMCELGNAASETAHGLVATNTEVITGGAGLQARRSLVTNQPMGGDLLLTMAVDPVKRNYFSLKLWGSDVNANAGRIYVYVVSGGVNYQIGYRHEGDYQVLNSVSDSPALPGRFFYATTLLPLAMTQGKTSLTLRLQNTGRVYAFGAGTAPAGNYQYPQSLPGRSIYRAYTHTDPLLVLTGETQGTVPATTLRTSPTEATLQPGGTFYNTVNNGILNRLATATSVSSFSSGDVYLLARAYSSATMSSYHSAALVRKVVALLDAFATDSYASGGKAAAGGWGGSYGGLGQAITLLRPQLESYLGASVSYGVAVGPKTRRVAWADMLLASRDYGRLNRNSWAIANQSLLANTSIYQANRGMLDLGDSRALTEAQGQRYLLEAIGLRPWLGSDLGTAAGSGSSLLFGSNYYMITQKGLSREHGYVGGSYGEVSFFAAYFYRLTGNAEFLAQNIKLIKGRGNMRQPTQDPDGSTYHPLMRAVGLLAWRGVSECDSDFNTTPAYGDRFQTPGFLYSAAASLDPTAIGYAKQVLADQQVLAYLSSLSTSDALTLDVFDDYYTVKNAPDSGIRLPMTDGQPDYAWADEENGIVAVKHGAERLWLSAYWMAKNGTGINGLARFHYMAATYDQYGILETNPQFSYSGTTITRPNQIDKPDVDAYTAPSSPTPPTQAYAGELLPTATSELASGAAEPFIGRADFYAFRFGPYLVGLNQSLTKTGTLRVLNGESGPDLIAGGTYSGTVSVPPRTTRLLYLPNLQDPAPVPTEPLLLTLAGTTSSQTTLSWRAASGATTYTVKRGTTKGGPYAALATGLTSTTYTDAALAAGTNYYVVVGVNANGESYPSMEANTVGYAPAAAPVITSSLAVSVPLGQPLEYTIAALHSATSFGATGLPTGFSLNPATGNVTGTPTAAGTSSITLTATNASGTDTKTLVLTVVAPAAPVLSGPTAVSGYVGTPLGYAIGASNAPTSYAATGLPPGLSLNPGTGLITGSPAAAGTFTFAVSATNAGGTSPAQAVTLTVAAAAMPVITSALAVRVVAGLAFAYSIEATYGPTSYAASGLPPGLSLDSGTGLLAGTPTQSGIYLIDLAATNGVGTAQAVLVLTVLGLPAPWVDTDISTSSAGYAYYSNGAFTVNGAGSDLGSTSDSFNYLYQAQTSANSGDVTLVARLTGIVTTSSQPKVGLMMRETLSAGSRDVNLFLDGSNGNARVSARSSPSYYRSYPGSVATGYASPLWLKLQRVGNVFTAYFSPDGSTYTTVATTTVSMSSAIYLGMLVCGRDGIMATATFDNVRINGVDVGSVPPAQAITFGPLADLAVGSADRAPGATASSGLRVIYASADPGIATIVNNQLHAVAVGTTTITAQQPGSDAWLAAPLVSRSLTVTAAPLPVSLVSFAAEATAGGAAQLTWTTASELHSAYFVVERSLDGRAFVALGQVAGHGTTATASHYAYLDAAAAGAGQPLYYRLRQVDLDGSSTYSPVRAVVVGSTAGWPAATLYPNPATNVATLDLSALPATATYQVQVLDLAGRVLHQATLAGGQARPLALAGLPTGSYQVLLTSPASPRQVLRLLVQ